MQSEQEEEGEPHLGLVSLALPLGLLSSSQLYSMAGQTQEQEQQLAQLNVLLSAVHRTRTALPRLVSTVSSSSSSGDRTALYRTAHQECHAAITALQDQLDQNARTLDHADQLVSLDPLPLPPPPPPPPIPTSNPTASWDQVQDILQTAKTKHRHHHRYPPPPPQTQLPIPTTPADLDALLKAITTHYHPRVRIRSIGSRQLEFTLRGVLRARISLRWEEDEDDHTGCQADYVACYSLIEDVRSAFILYLRGRLTDPPLHSRSRNLAMSIRNSPSSAPSRIRPSTSSIRDAAHPPPPSDHSKKSS